MQAPEGAHSPPVLETSKPVQDYGHAKVTRDELQVRKLDFLPKSMQGFYSVTIDNIT